MSAESDPVRHLYAHIPFCHRICPYCGFYKHAHGSTSMSGFVAAMLGELDLRLQSTALRPRTIYFGGGTPTALSETHLETLLRGMRERLDYSELEEFTVEVNPRTLPASKAQMMRSLGVTRASLGVQAWDAETLKTLGRDHSPEEARETFAVLRAAGFPSVSLDLMFSIPGQSNEAWEASLRETLRLRPDHISTYNLNYEEDTEFIERLRRGQYGENQDRDATHFHRAAEMLGAAGFEHYEISNHALPGFRSQHNEAYWFGADYLGIGPSAVGTVGLKRTQNVADTAAYIEQVEKGALPIGNAESLTDEERRTERFGLELRTARGLAADQVREASQKMLGILQRDGLLVVEDGFVRLTPEGKALADSIAVALLD